MSDPFMEVNYGDFTKNIPAGKGEFKQRTAPINTMSLVINFLSHSCNIYIRLMSNSMAKVS